MNLYRTNFNIIAKIKIVYFIFIYFIATKIYFYTLNNYDILFENFYLWNFLLKEIHILDVAFNHFTIFIIT